MRRVELIGGDPLAELQRLADALEPVPVQTYMTSDGPRTPEPVPCVWSPAFDGECSRGRKGCNAVHPTDAPLWPEDKAERTCPNCRVLHAPSGCPIKPDPRPGQPVVAPTVADLQAVVADALDAIVRGKGGEAYDILLRSTAADFYGPFRERNRVRQERDDAREELARLRECPTKAQVNGPASEEVARMVHAFLDEGRKQAVRDLAARVRELEARSDYPRIGLCPVCSKLQAEIDGCDCGEPRPETALPATEHERK